MKVFRWGLYSLIGIALWSVAVRAFFEMLWMLGV